MSIQIPEELSNDVDRSERVIADLFSNLPDTWIVFHSVPWSQRHGTRLDIGEADFVVANQEIGILVIEVKGGQIELKDGIWTSTPFKSNTKIRLGKSPFDQVTRNKFAIQKKLRDISGLQDLRLGQLVAFPDSIFRIPNTVSLEENQLLDAKQMIDMRKIGDEISNLATKQGITGKIPEMSWQKIVEALSPTIQIQSLAEFQWNTTLKKIEVETSRTLEMTNEQISVLQALSRNSRLAITGPAGTGKTLLAFEQARKIAEMGKVLFVIGKHPMVDLVKENLKKRGVQLVGFSEERNGVFVIHVDKLIVEIRNEAAKNNPNIPLPRKKGNQRKYWRLKRDFELCQPNVSARFDAIVLDEAQEMRPEVLDQLSLLLKNPGKSPFWIFFDPKQSFYNAWKPPFVTQVLSLTENCRNPIEIQKSYSEIVPVSSSRSKVESGIEPIFIELDQAEMPETMLIETAQKTITEGFKPRNIKILLLRKENSFRKVFGAYLRERKIKRYNFPEVITVGNFKGRECQVVILYLNVDLETKDWNRLFYEGASRAQVKLIIVGESGYLDHVRKLGSIAS